MKEVERCGEWILECMKEPMDEKKSLFAVVLWIALAVAMVISLFWVDLVNAKELTASYYSVASLKEEGTTSYSNNVMANGERFADDKMVAASCDYKLGTKVRVTNKANGKSVEVIIADRTNKRFKGKRIDLSSGAFIKVASLEQGLFQAEVEVI